MDIQMPKLNGFEAAKKIRELQDPINSSVPILALTANIFDEDRDKARISGMNGFIPKPIETGYMMSMIADVLRSEYGEV
jgi:CheY-like chemotaxis protein